MNAIRKPRAAPSAPERAWSLLASRPHFALALGIAGVLCAEAARGRSTTGFASFFPVAQAALAGAALFVAWRAQERLELRRLLLLAVLFQVGWIAVHLALGVRADDDSAIVYPSDGQRLLHGDYPHSVYPSGAVVLFALETWLGAGATRVSNAFLMILPQVTAVAAIWRLNTRRSRWFATFVALWPLNAFYWEFRYELAPTAALVFGLLCAQRERWAVAGAWFGLGAALKWTPGISLIGIALWLIGRRAWSSAIAHVAAGATVFAAVDLPFAVWRPAAFFAAYSWQARRGMIAESVFYLPLRLLGLARVDTVPYAAAVRPAWADSAALAVQALVIAGLLCMLAYARRRSDAVALAALLAAAFLLTNRVFSAQFLVTILAAWAVAGSLVACTRRQQLTIGILAAGATVGNVLVYPAQAALWTGWSAAMFLCACGVTVALVVLAAAGGRDVSAGHPIAAVRS